MTTSSFPGGTSITALDVYDTAAGDGVCGGSPHLHLASTEAYVVTAGTGELHTLDATGFRRTPLEAGVVVWFTPGTIHRAVNFGDLQVLVVMSNAGLPEAGDAVLTFPAEVLADPDRYAEAVRLPAGGSEESRALAAAMRRDLAVEGFAELQGRIAAEGQAALEEFYAAAGQLVAPRAASWGELVRERPLRAAEWGLAMAEAVAGGDVTHLGEGSVRVARPQQEVRAFGMCGRLRTYDVSDHEPLG